jgi:phage antirepressor YoqD-like protein
MDGKNSLVQGTLFPELDDVAVSSSAEIESPPKKKRQSVKELKEEILNLKKENSEKQNEIERLQKEQEKLAFKAEAYDDLIESNSLFPIGIIAKNFGRSAQWLNNYLHNKNIQYKRDDVWLLYAKYEKKGLTRICWYSYSEDSHGRPLQRPHTYWTGKGLVFIRELLKADGLLKD